MVWLIDGEILPATRAHVENKTAEIDVSIRVEHRHAQATLTCRLICHHNATSRESAPKASITDVSTTILLFCKF